MTSKETIQIRLPKEEKLILDVYCEKTGRTQTDVLREFIRSLQER
jgi:predicted DNA-binding protein